MSEFQRALSNFDSALTVAVEPFVVHLRAAEKAASADAPDAGENDTSAGTCIPSMLTEYLSVEPDCRSLFAVWDNRSGKHQVSPPRIRPATVPATAGGAG